MGVIKGDTRSLDYGLYDLGFIVQGLVGHFWER